MVKVNGTSSSANSDHIAIHVNGRPVSRSMVGLNTGHQIACHLNEVISLTAGSYFQISQQFNGNNLSDHIYNSLYVEYLQGEREE